MPIGWSNNYGRPPAAPEQPSQDPPAKSQDQPPAAQPMSEQQRAETLLQLRNLSFQVQDQQERTNMTKEQQKIIDDHAAEQQAEAEGRIRIEGLLQKPVSELTEEDKKAIWAALRQSDWTK
jgi:hypothetical protein